MTVSSRGAFYTPAAIAEYLCRELAVHRPAVVLEPSCGTGVFLEALSNWLDPLPEVTAVEIHADSLAKCAGTEAQLVAGNFLHQHPQRRYDAVIGNPPYVRYHHMSGGDIQACRDSAEVAGVVLPGLFSSWAGHLIHATRFLKPGGHLAMVLPRELMFAQYASGVRELLHRSFDSVCVEFVADQVFAGAQVSVVLVFASGFGATTDEVCTRTVEDLRRAGNGHWQRCPVSGGDPWRTPSTDPDQMVPLSTWGRVRVGTLTGADKFFVLSASQVRKHGLTHHDVSPIYPLGPRTGRGLVYDLHAQQTADASGARSYLFRPDGELSDAARSMISAGVRAGFDTGYKCRHRRRWWQVPNVGIADALIPVFFDKAVSITSNSAGVGHLNSMLGLWRHEDIDPSLFELLPAAVLHPAAQNSARAASRGYGSGVRQFIPSEAKQWMVPSPEWVSQRSRCLRAQWGRVDTAVQSGRWGEAGVLVRRCLD